MSNRLRLFVAVPVAPEALRMACRFPDEWQAVPASNWHLTLAFLGDCERQQVGLLAGCIDRCCAAFTATSVLLDQWRFLPVNRHPRCLALVGDGQPLVDCYEFLWRELTGLGWQMPARAFLLHLTVAHRRTSSDWQPEVLPRLVLPVESMCIYESQQTPVGARYQRLYCQHFKVR